MEENTEAAPEGAVDQAAAVPELIEHYATRLAQLVNMLEPSRESSLAATKLDEFFFWTSAALRKQQQPETEAAK